MVFFYFFVCFHSGEKGKRGTSHFAGAFCVSVFVLVPAQEVGGAQAGADPSCTGSRIGFGIFRIFICNLGNAIFPVL